MKKLTFIEFFAACQTTDFNNIQPIYLEYATKFINNLFLNQNIHHGDCTKQCETCYLCLLEEYLKDYNDYFFNEEQWRKENGY